MFRGCIFSIIYQNPAAINHWLGVGLLVGGGKVRVMYLLSKLSEVN